MGAFNKRIFKTPGVYTEENNIFGNNSIYRNNKHISFPSNGGNNGGSKYLVDEISGDIIMSENNEIIEQEK